MHLQKSNPLAITTGVPFSIPTFLFIIRFVSYLSEPPNLLKFVNPLFFKLSIISSDTAVVPPKYI